MAKKSTTTYQIVIQNAEDQSFIKRLLEIYGYQEEEPGIFSEKPVPRSKAKIVTPTSKSTVSTQSKVTQQPSSAKSTASKKATAVKVKKTTTKAVPVKSTEAATKASTPAKPTKARTGNAGVKKTQSTKPKKRS